MLDKCWAHWGDIDTISLILPDDKKKQISTKLAQLEADMKLTIASLEAKDAVKSKLIAKATIKFSNKLYRSRLYEILSMLLEFLPADKKISPEITRLKMQLQEGIHYTFSSSERFRSPYPSYLFFSQPGHGERFSSKLAREGVSGELVATVADKIRATEISPDYLRVEMYFAPFRGALHPFVLNNRTLVAFSRAKVAISRFVPCMPTQDLINRIDKLDPESYPNAISAETASEESTTTMLPGPGTLY